MTLSISISPGAEAKLIERAAAEGKDPTAYAAELVESAVSRPTLQELLSKSQAEFASTGMGRQEMMDFGRELLEKVRDEKAKGA
jgi:hypothetical protein